MGLHREKMMEQQIEMFDGSAIDEYYEFIKHPEDEDKGAVQITRGPFLGLIYNYGEYKFTKVDEETGNPSVMFSFNVLDIPEEMVGVEYPDEMKESFSKLLGDILVDIITKDLDNKARVEYDNTDREGDIDESFERRVFYENDTPLPTE
jgi:outer membrane protease